MLKRVWCEDDGVLTFEWTLLTTLVVIGVIGGLTGVRDAILYESQGVAGAMISLDQSYYIAPPMSVTVSPSNGGMQTGSYASGASSSSFFDDRPRAVGRVASRAATANDTQTVIPLTFQ